MAQAAKTEDGYGARVPDLPGCIAAGDTLEETAQLISLTLINRFCPLDRAPPRRCYAALGRVLR